MNNVDRDTGASRLDVSHRNSSNFTKIFSGRTVVAPPYLADWVRQMTYYAQTEWQPDGTVPPNQKTVSPACLAVSKLCLLNSHTIATL